MVKYLKMFINWISSLIDGLDGGVQRDLMDNEHIIMQQLFNGQRSKLTTQQSMDLFDKIEDQYYLKIKDRFFDLHEIKSNTEKEIEMIENYTNGKKKNI